MPRLPVAMFAIKEILRLHHAAGRTQREISRVTGVSQPAASDAELYAELYPQAAGSARHSQPDFAHVHDQLRRFKRVTLEQLWSEYCAAREPGRSYSYSQFCAQRGPP